LKAHENQVNLASYKQKGHYESDTRNLFLEHKKT